MEFTQGMPTGQDTSSMSKMRAVTNTYFESIDTKDASPVGKENVILVAIALLIGVSTILFVCDTFMKLLASSGFYTDIEKLFA